MSKPVVSAKGPTSTDTIATSSPKDLKSVLPLLSAALKRDTNPVAIDAELAVYSISHRADGGLLLRPFIPDIGSLLSSEDERLSGGAVVILSNLTRANSDLTVPIMMKHLAGPTKPTLVKADIVFVLLDYKESNPKALQAIEDFLHVPMSAQVQIATLKALGTHHVATSAMNDFAIESLDDTNKDVRIAAIYAVDALPSETSRQAGAKLTKMATDPSEDQEVRTLAEKSLQHKLMTAPKQ